MKPYEWILFDADETLFEFDALRGLKLMFSRFGINFSDADFSEYQLVNKPLWVQYQNGEISATQLQYQRFQSWAERLDETPKTLNSAFLSAMADICAPLQGAANLLNTLRGKMKLGIITNGFTELQQVRLERTGFRDHFDVLIISEQVGVAKPHPEIFEYALSAMGHPSRERVLMVGDNPDSDILGGLNAGLHTCWVNADNKPEPTDIKPHYQVSSLSELESLLVQS
ncbi:MULTISPECIES: pyrimidine 5'-nucleotidase [Gammaproteobacteria]|uniref:Nucleotidase n=1 Tax=Leclercia adecarboxylata TaxID=83655 RepID=A0A2Z2E2Z4_9ENTR|nr:MULTISPECIES: pyrimidine 5'-nucleotidase [Enterobacterales]MCM8482164.1 pyrimidine 5'-nucleotidase [Enterobacter hormaechei]PSF19212.1 dUMP phosphatase [Escherichia coli]HBZ3551280.1 pyrimidine 5'-nucleotidase [Klebsiella pneumoniae]API82364.1 Putative nucleotidase [Leclercia adecarboxylata]MBK0353825.1 pyrimidine 5'-nucleotidase [Leclercia adecarboxylata]